VVIGGDRYVEEMDSDEVEERCISPRMKKEPGIRDLDAMRDGGREGDARQTQTRLGKR
jgi:hypothetical protein